MKQSYYLTAAVLGFIITTAVVGLTSFAFSGNNAPLMPGRIQGMKQALIDGDYDTWAAAMQEKVDLLRQSADNLESQINQETFNKIQEAQQLAQSGDVEGARAIFEELGMTGPGFHGMGPGFHKGFRFGQQPNDQQSDD